jgi:uncharacterized protein
MGLPRPLDAVEIRVLGSLMEKQQTTPEYYPLTLNALLAACNQKSNRDPVMELSEGDVRGALERLRAHALVWPTLGARVPRWEHSLTRRLELDPATAAVLTSLFLRGPQTPGELRGRSERMHPFASVAEVEATLGAVAARPEPLVTELPRQPGQKESRWAHLVGGPVEATAVAPVALADRVERLEARLDELAAELESLRSRCSG